MEPNNDMAGAPNAQNQPVAPAGPAPVKPPVKPAPVNPVEQALASAPAESAPMAPVKKPSKWPIYGMIIFLILAIGGIGFGVWAMMNGNTQKTNYEKQVSDLKSQNNRLLDQIAEAGDNCNEEIIIDGGGDATDTINTADYIYVGEWGYMIKIPEELRTVSYSFEQRNGYMVLYVSGVKLLSGGIQYFPEFGDISKSGGLGAVSRYPKNQEVMGGNVLVFSDEQYDYYYSHPQAVYSVDEEEKNWEKETVELIQQMLSNKDSYSKF